MERNVLLTIAYDGTEFHGWQRQPGLRTVQGELERVLSTLCDMEITVNGTSRTDAGVHALGQRASFTGDFSIPCDRIVLAGNNLLAGGANSRKAGDVKILSAEEAAPDFHARFSCRGKKYIYKMTTGADVDIFRRNYCWQIKDALDISLMNQAAEHITGTHDFKCFQAAGGEEKETTVRTVHSLEVLQSGNEMELHIEGDGFLYNMVRIITGTLVQVGMGRMDPGYLKVIVDGRDRTLAGPTAPPQGLYLAEVFF